MKKAVYIFGLAALAFATACSQGPSEAEIQATIEAGVRATVEAQRAAEPVLIAVTATPPPTSTPGPPPTVAPTPAPVFVEITATPSPTATPRPTAMLTPAPVLLEPTFTPSPTAVPDIPTRTATATPTPEPYEVARWTGKATKNTETFSIPSSQWIIAWDTQPDPQLSDFNFQIYVFNEDGSLFAVAANVIGADNDSSVMRGAGDYYLTINTAQPYSIVIMALP